MLTLMLICGHGAVGGDVRLMEDEVLPPPSFDIDQADQADQAEG